MTKFDYIVLDHGERYPEDATGVASAYPPDEKYLSDIATDMAEFEWDNCDGWASSWPLTFEMYHEGVKIGKRKVDMEAVPTFFAVGSD